MGEIPTEHYRFVQVLSTFSAAESLHDPEYRGLAHQAAELLIPLNTHARRLFMAFRKYIVMQSTAIAQHASHFAVALDDILRQGEFHPLTCLMGARKLQVYRF